MHSSGWLCFGTMAPSYSLSFLDCPNYLQDRLLRFRCHLCMAVFSILFLKVVAQYIYEPPDCVQAHSTTSFVFAFFVHDSRTRVRTPYQKYSRSSSLSEALDRFPFANSHTRWDNSRVRGEVRCWMEQRRPAVLFATAQMMSVRVIFL